jgi:hypothetical protein
MKDEMQAAGGRSFNPSTPNLKTSTLIPHHPSRPPTHIQVCPSLVRLLACFEDDDEVQVVMEICNGGDIQQLSEVGWWRVCAQRV